MTLKKIVLLMCFMMFETHGATLPDWFYSLQPSSANEIIGYGANSSLEGAKKNALAEV